MTTVYGKDKEGFYHYDPESGETPQDVGRFHSDLTLEELNTLTNEEKMDYSYSRIAGKYDDYDSAIIDAMYEQMARLTVHLQNVIFATDLATLTEYGCRDPIGQGYDKKLATAKKYLNELKSR